MKRRMSLFVVLLFALSLVLTACGSSESAPQFRMGMAWLAAEHTMTAKAAFSFKEKIERESNGRIEATVYHSQQISTPDRENAEKTQQNIIQMTSVPLYTITEYSGIQEFTVSEIPFMFWSIEELDAMVDSDFFAPYYKRFEEQTGLMIVGGYAQGAIKVATTKKAFRLPEDIKGLKLRTQVSEIYMDTLDEWGAAPTPMAFGEVFTALRQGTVEGMIGSTQMIWDEGFYEPLSHIADVNPFLNYHLILVNKQFYTSLPDDLKKIFDDCIKFYENLGRVTVGQADESFLDLMQDAGLTVVRLTPEERQVWINATKKTYDKAKAKLSAEFVNAAEEFLAKLR